MPFFMGGGQRLRDRAAEFQNAIDGKTTLWYELVERLAFN